MSNGDTPQGAPEVKKDAANEAAAAKADEKAKVRQEADTAPAGVDDTPLPTELGERNRPGFETPDGQTDISEKPGFRAFNEKILMMAKKI